MPFQSKSQAHWMLAHDPTLAKQWWDETPDPRDLPAHVAHAQRKALSALTSNNATGSQVQSDPADRSIQQLNPKLARLAAMFGAPRNK